MKLKIYCEKNEDNIQEQSLRGFLTKRCPILEICSKLTGEDLSRSVISIKLECKSMKTTLPHGCSPVHLLHICRTPLEDSF